MDSPRFVGGDESRSPERISGVNMLLLGRRNYEDGAETMKPSLRDIILKAQREMRRADGRQTPEDVSTERQFKDMQAMKQFASFHLSLATAHEIEPAVAWNGTAAIARFSSDDQPFTVRKDATEFVLLAGDESGRELARVAAKDGFEAGTKFLSAVGDFLGLSGAEVPEL